ncbi:adenylate/guanylate cyclase domain-containing protein [Actinoplanes sp. NPDC049596]|uniref:adenylate/guanylate cyclase domain-containing protein n=1 Tax=unclassified Actinoplanes TaxID=2626549 RepID=UPI00341D0FBC
MDPVAGRGGPARVIVWAAHLAAPMVGLWLLIARPALDGHWHHDPAHFWLVLVVAATSLTLAVMVNEAARRRADIRLFLVGLSFLVAAALLGLHALATPGVLLDGPNKIFEYASPVGLAAAAVPAAASALELPAGLMRWAGLLRVGALLLAGLLAVVAPSTEALALIAFGLFAVPAIRYYALYRERRAVMLLSVLTAFVLLAESAVAMAVGRNWHASWWEWHLLMAAGFSYVAYSAWVQYRNEGAATGLFTAVGTEFTVRRLRASYGTALEALVEALGHRERGTLTEAGMTATTERLARRFELTEGQTAVLTRAADALAGERDQIRKLDALVAVSRDARVLVSDADLLEGAVRRIAGTFEHYTVRIGLVEDHQLIFRDAAAGGRRDFEWAAAEGAMKGREPVVDAYGNVVLPLIVKGHAAGVLVAGRGGTAPERDVALLASLAGQLSIALENARLYRQLDVLFRQYMSPDVATALVADPSQAALGGAVVEVTSLFADLRGFTTFSEESTPGEIVGMLNEYFDVATKVVLGQCGTVVQFQGDALMALFNAPARQADHALRAARAALMMQCAVDKIAAGRPGWPRFRVGVNTGEALVGNIGGSELRNFNAMGDAVNVAARLEAQAAPGQVVIGAATLDRIGPPAVVTPLGDLMVKGRRQPVTAYVLDGLREEGTWRS